MVKLEDNIDREELAAVWWPGVCALPESEVIKLVLGQTEPAMIANDWSAVIAHKKAEGAHIEQANGYSIVSEIFNFKPWIEHTSKNEYYTGFKERISDDELDATPVRKLNKWQAAYERCFITLKAMIPLTELLSASTKFVCRIKEGVAWIFSKNVFVLVLLFSNPPMVSAVDTYNSTAVVSPPSPQPLNMAHQLAPPPPPPPMRATRRGFFPLGPPSPSEMKKRLNLTESKREWGLPRKRSPPSCLPAC